MSEGSFGENHLPKLSVVGYDLYTQHLSLGNVMVRAVKLLNVYH